MDIGKTLEELWTRAGFSSLGELQKSSGVTVATLSRIKNNVQKPQPETLKKLAPALGVDYMELLKIAGYISDYDITTDYLPAINDKPASDATDNTTNIFFGECLKELRKSVGFTQQKVADDLGFSRGRLNNYEQGTREPDIEMLKALAKYYNVSTDYLIGNKEIVTQDNPNPEIAKLLKDHGIKKLQLLSGYTLEDVQKLVEIGNIMRNKKTED